MGLGSQWCEPAAVLNSGPRASERGGTRTASIALALVLVALSACALFGALFSYQAGAAAKHAISTSNAFEDARRYILAEEAEEQKYRLAPSAEVRLQHGRAAASLTESLARARSLGAAALMIEEVSARHKEYLLAAERVFEAVDRGNGALAKEIDDREADPAFDVIERRIMAGAEAHRTDAAEHLQGLAEIQRTVLISTVLMFALGMGLILFFWSRLRRYRRQAEDSLLREATAIRQSERRFRSLVQNASDVVLVCSPSGMISYQSPTAETVLGYERDRLLGQPLADLVHLDDRPVLQELFDGLQVAPGVTRGIEVQLRTPDGAWRYFDLVLTNLLHDPSVAGLVVTARDVTERKAFEEQLTKQACYDSLTGLPNRTLFGDRLNQALARAGHSGRVGLLFLDLDNFKQVNDSLGHHAGDKLLAQAASRLQACVGGENTIARLGGDEFVILIEDISGEAEAAVLADRIERDFGAPFRIQDREFVITASIGIAFGRAGQGTADSILRDADLAMYRAKTDGKARCAIFDSSMRSQAIERINLETNLRRAINNGELCLHYQPILYLETGKIAGVEALVRWQDPARGLIPPGDFIPLAEHTGLIIPLGQRVLEEACRQVVDWQTRFPMKPPLTVSVNLSPRQFQQPNLANEIKRTLLETGLAPTSLRLEITEGVIMQEIESTITILSQLKELGVILAIDDFGTGYSSLAYLKRLPLDVIKIDRAFVNGIAHGVQERAIVRAIISMAKSLGLTITAEGVETADQAALLRAWGCDRGQGYYFARPLDLVGFNDFLHAAALRHNERQVA